MLSSTRCVTASIARPARSLPCRIGGACNLWNTFQRNDIVRHRNELAKSAPGGPMRQLIRRVVLGLALAVLASPGMALEFKPAVVYDVGTKFDKSFNESVWNGVEKFTAETGIAVTEFQITNEAQREQAMRRLVQRGATLVIAVGFSQADAIDAVAADHPDRQFAIIDVFWLDRPNLRQYAFKEHEGSYLVGVAAALASKTGTVGFIGGMDIPLIRKFQCGYVQGVRAARSDVTVLQAMIGTTPSAWNDPTRATELARSQFDRDADVIYHAAGASGTAVIQTAVEAGRLAIGVDSNQNGMAPGSVLTSMLKRVDVATYRTLVDAMNGRFTAGVNVLGLAEGGVDWALDEHNAPLVSEEMRASIEKARDDIISGATRVHDYTTDSACPG